MTYVKESLNTFFDEVISIVDSCTLEKEMPNIKNFKSILYLSFAAFLQYYGYENIDIIYDSFLNTSFNEINLKPKKSIINFQLPAYIRTRYQEEDGKILLEDHMNIINNRYVDIKTWLNFFIHEMNHVVNSKNNRVIDDRYIRCGISIYDVKKKTDINKGINEAFNTLQTEEIENLVYLFSKEKIVTPYFYQILKKIRKCEHLEHEYEPYPLRTHIIRPLYENKGFKKIYEERTLDGCIDEIEYEFDKKTYKNAFSDLSNLIDQCNDDIGIDEQRDTVVKAKTIVKRYIVNT